MSTRDNTSDQQVFKAFEDLITSNVTSFGIGIDTSNFDGGVMFFMDSYAYGDGDAAITLQDSPDNSVWTDIPDEKLIKPNGDIVISSEPAIGDTVPRIGAFSNQKYARVKLVMTNLTVDSAFKGYAVALSELRPIDDLT